MKITAKTVITTSLGSGQKDKIFYDDDIPGFGLRLRQSGSRVLVFTYKHGGLTRRMSLGNAIPEAFAGCSQTRR